MPGYVITSVFEVGDGKPPLGPGVLERAWGRGHRFSYCDGRMLTLVVELTAIDVGSAFESLLSRAEMVWQGLGHGALGPPVTLRVQGAVDASEVPAGIPPADDTPPQERARRRAVKALRRFRSTDAGLVLLPDDGLYVDDPRDEDDDGGLAGVREPRRPSPGPPGLQAARDLPTELDQAAAS